MIDKIQDICQESTTAIQDIQLSDYFSEAYVTNPDLTKRTVGQDKFDGEGSTKSQAWTAPRSFWNHDAIRQALRAPERDRRLEQISDRVGRSFDWALNDENIGLSQWLKSEGGIFWVRGKPGSGKSTLLKYLYRHRQTTELLRASSWDSKLVYASFFFHYRGNSVQKSFEGLLGSLLSQTLEQQEPLTQCIYPILAARCSNRIKSRFAIDLQNLAERFPNDETNSQVRDAFKEMLGSMRGDDDMTSTLADIFAILESPHVNGKHQNNSSRHPSPNTQNISVEANKLFAQYKAHAETTPWTLDELEHALQLVISQNLTKLSLCLLLDALDEYDGHPEFIASFVRNLVRSSSAEDTSSKTRLRILVSSRPWKEFEQEFGPGPGLQIHDHTRGDIEAVCAAKIPRNELALDLFKPLVPIIVERAQGVFLWVTLVMSALLTVVGHRTKVPFRDLKRELHETLVSLPSELNNFYGIILERLPHNNRKECYAIMESISRSGEVILLSDLIRIVHTSRSQTFEQARMATAAGLMSPLEQWRAYIATVTGGLVEVATWLEGQEGVQFMHQTVKDFVEDPRFKQLTLGPDLARLSHENGHTFLAKAALTRPRGLDDTFAWHAYHAERTTAYSLYGFISTIPWKEESYFFLLDKPINGRAGTGCSEDTNTKLTSALELAVACGLELCVTECLEADPQSLRRPLVSKELDFVQLLVVSLNRTSSTTSRSVRIAKHLVKHGLQINDNSSGVWLLILRLFDAGAVEESHAAWSAIQHQELATALAQSWPVIRSTTSHSTVNELSEDGLSRSMMRGFNWEEGALSKTSFILISALMRRGFDPNARSTFILTREFRWVEGTLMDACVDGSDWGTSSASSFGNPGELATVRYKSEVICLLLQWGGKLYRTNASEWREFVKLHKEAGLQTAIFRRHGFPQWINTASQPGSDKRTKPLAWLKDRVGLHRFRKPTD